MHVDHRVQVVQRLVLLRNRALALLQKNDENENGYAQKIYSHKEGSFDVFNETWQNVLVVDWRAMPRLLQAKGKVIPLLLVHNFQERL